MDYVSLSVRRLPDAPRTFLQELEWSFQFQATTDPDAVGVQVHALNLEYLAARIEREHENGSAVLEWLPEGWTHKPIHDWGCDGLLRIAVVNAMRNIRPDWHELFKANQDMVAVNSRPTSTMVTAALKVPVPAATS